ncbi:MAG: hypothetical protein ACI9MC_002312 [Kiritimatiellia bacterium]|jgi:hypothetical protein
MASEEAGGTASVQDFRWERWLDQCVESYFVSVFRPELQADERLRAAYRFAKVAQSLQAGGQSAQDYLFRQLEVHDTQRRNTAARVLSDMVDETSVQTLLHAYIRPEPLWLSPSHLVRAARRIPLDPELVTLLPTASRRVRPSLLRGLLAHERPSARSLFERLLDGADAPMAEAAVEAVARWNNRGALWMVLYKVDGTDEPPPALIPAAIRAAQWLASSGDRAALDWLEERTGDVDLEIAALAHSALGLLGWGGCVVDLEALLDEADGAALSWTLEAASHLGSGALVPALCGVVRRFAMVDDDVTSDSPSDQAIRVLERLTGRWVPVELSSYDIHGNYDAATRMRSALLFSAMADDLDPDLRYLEGEPLCPHHLVGELLSPYPPRALRAAIQLVSITGEDHGYDVREDLVGNVDALQAWRGSWGEAREGGAGRWTWRAASDRSPG